MGFAKLVGFSDSYILFKKYFPKQRGPGMFKLQKLVEDSLQIISIDKFHEGTCTNIVKTHIYFPFQRRRESLLEKGSDNKSIITKNKAVLEKILLLLKKN